MSFTLSQVATLLATTPGRIKVLIQRNQMALTWKSESAAAAGILADDEADETGGRKWRRFSATDVLLSSTQIEMLRQVGLSSVFTPSVAQAVLSNTSGELPGLLLRRGPDVWLGYVGAPAGWDVNADGNRPGGYHALGTLEEIARRVAAEEREHIDAASAPLRVDLVNVSRILRDLEARAAMAGIAFMPTLFAELRAGTDFQGIPIVHAASAELEFYRRAAKDESK